MEDPYEALAAMLMWYCGSHSYCQFCFLGWYSILLEMLALDPKDYLAIGVMIALLIFLVIAWDNLL